MNIRNHFANAEVFLDFASEMVDNEDYAGAQEALAKAYAHTRELLTRIQKLSVIQYKEKHETPNPLKGFKCQTPNPLKP